MNNGEGKLNDTEILWLINVTNIKFTMADHLVNYVVLLIKHGDDMPCIKSKGWNDQDMIIVGF